MDTATLIQAIPLAKWHSNLNPLNWVTMGVIESGQFILMKSNGYKIVMPGFVAFMLYKNRELLSCEKAEEFFGMFEQIIKGQSDADIIELKALADLQKIFNS